MNIVFFSSSQFAVPALKALLFTSHRVCCIVTQPDRQKGRGLSMGETAIKAAAREAGLNIYQPNNINAPEAIKFLKIYTPDLFVVAAYGQILAPEVLALPKIFSLNVHASLLPKYRGAAPINWAIINGDKTTGITIMKVVKKMDAGPVILQEAVGISDDDTAVTLENKLSVIAAGLLINSIEVIENNNYNFTPQDEGRVTLAPKIKKEDGLIKWDKPAQDIYNLIRGCLSWPGAFTYSKGKLLKILKARVTKSQSHHVSCSNRRK